MEFCPRPNGVRTNTESIGSKKKSVSDFLVWLRLSTAGVQKAEKVLAVAHSVKVTACVANFPVDPNKLRMMLSFH